jgi:hypothetical protein
MTEPTKGCVINEYNVCCTCAYFETLQGLIDKSRIVRICNNHGIVSKPNNSCEDHKAKEK